jgi:hypothetical protein
MELRCWDCDELVEPIKEPNPSVDPDDPPSYDLLCPKCRFVFSTHWLDEIPEAGR